MLLAATDALEFGDGLSQSQFNATRLHQMAVIRCLEAIGEAAAKVSQDFRTAHPVIEWREIIGMRHRLIHNYAAIRLDVVWAVLHDKLPGLIAALKPLIPPEDNSQVP